MDLCRVTAIDYDRKYSEGLKFLLTSSENFDFVASYQDHEEASRNFKKDLPDLILLDIDVLSASGACLVSSLKKHYHRLKIVFLVQGIDQFQLIELFKIGADGFILKGDGYVALLDQLELLLENGCVISPKLFKILIERLQRNFFSPLTNRETEVLEHFAIGKPYSLVAKDLSVSNETIKSHLKNIYSKLSAKTKAEALRVAKEQRYITAM